MSSFAGKRPGAASGGEVAATTRLGPGKHTLVERLPAVQRVAGPAAADDAAVHTSAQRGIASPAQPLPFRDIVQRLFGRHDISGVQAHTGAEAAASAHDMGAQAYASGNHVVLGGGADLHTVAHEAAHVVQQRGGVRLQGGVGQAGDSYEQHADAVADKVVRGESAEPLLDQMVSGAGTTGPAQGPVQRTLTRNGTALDLKNKEDKAAYEAAKTRLQSKDRTLLDIMRLKRPNESRDLDEYVAELLAGTRQHKQAKRIAARRPGPVSSADLQQQLGEIRCGGFRFRPDRLEHSGNWISEEVEVGNASIHANLNIIVGYGAGKYTVDVDAVHLTARAKERIVQIRNLRAKKPDPASAKQKDDKKRSQKVAEVAAAAAAAPAAAAGAAAAGAAAAGAGAAAPAKSELSQIATISLHQSTAADGAAWNHGSKDAAKKNQTLCEMGFRADGDEATGDMDAFLAAIAAVGICNARTIKQEFPALVLQQLMPADAAANRAGAPAAAADADADGDGDADADAPAAAQASVSAAAAAHGGAAPAAARGDAAAAPNGGGAAAAAPRALRPRPVVIAGGARSDLPPVTNIDDI